MLVKHLMQQNNKYHWWQSDTLVLVAVSGGVDSMVLLELLLQLPEEERPIIGVAHINHKLRAESDNEAHAVQLFCEQRGLPFYLKEWHVGTVITENVEQAARQVRYEFMQQIMEMAGYSVVLTAHHEGDQAETILMRLISGYRLPYLMGIQQTRSFYSGKLVRPLLTVSKSDLYAYAQLHDIPYFEDESNRTTTYFRNRVRHNYLPALAKENPQATQHFIHLGQEVQAYYDVVEELIQPIYASIVQTDSTSWVINVSKFQALSASFQYVIVQKLVIELIQVGIVVSQQVEMSLRQLLLSDKPNHTILLKNEWVCQRAYTEAKIYQKKSQLFIKSASFNVKLNSGRRLTSSEWLGFFAEDSVVIPSEYAKWQQLELTIPHEIADEVIVRKRQTGDRLIFNALGQSKKVARYFIDEKVPSDLREKSWVITTLSGRLIWLVPFKESYLSIQSETAKIQYKLVYCYQSDK